MFYVVSLSFSATATTEITTLSLHDALPILRAILCRPQIRTDEIGCVHPPTYPAIDPTCCADYRGRSDRLDRKSTRLNSSHVKISYAVFCLKKKKKTKSAELAYVHSECLVTR